MPGLKQTLINEFRIYRLVFRDKRTPLIGKVLLGLATGYLLLPFDIIPDYIPVFGQMDDLIIVPVLIALALKCIPGELIEEYRDKIRQEKQSR